jgi:hypothetical protein
MKLVGGRRRRKGSRKRGGNDTSDDTFPDASNDTVPDTIPDTSDEDEFLDQSNDNSSETVGGKGKRRKRVKKGGFFNKLAAPLLLFFGAKTLKDRHRRK